MLTARGFPQHANHTQWWSWQWMATQCDCLVIVPENGRTHTKLWAYFVFVPQAEWKVTYAPPPPHIYWLLRSIFILKRWGKGRKNTTAWHKRLRWQTTVMESIILNHLTSTQQLLKKKRQNREASVRLPETTEGRTTEVCGSRGAWRHQQLHVRVYDSAVRSSPACQ